MTLYVPLLKTCSTQRSLLQIHAHLLASGLHRDALLATKLIESYAKMGIIDATRLVFDGFSNPDAFMWGVVIKSYVRNHHFKESISLYHHGLHYHNFQLSSFVLTPVLQACSSIYDMPMGRKIHGRLIKDGFESDAVVATALIQMYGDAENLEDASKVFDEMPNRDVVSWSSMICSCVQCGQASRGLNLLSRMHLESVEEDWVLMLPLADICADMGLLREAKSVHGRILRRWTETDGRIAGSLITMYGNCHDLKSAKKIFENASKRNVVSWTAMISLYNQRSCYREALNIFAQMLKWEIEPNSVTMMGILFSCTQLGLFKEGNAVHGFSIRRSIDPHLNSLGSSMIAMYSTFRKIESCFGVFEVIEKKTILLWNSLITACMHNGLAEKALELFTHMLSEGILPDSFTLSSVLAACVHISNIFLGRQVHGIADKTGISSNTFVQNALINMYCKCGSIETAFKVFNEINDENVVAWNAMIGGLPDSGCSEKAIALFEQMHYHGVEMDSITYLSAIKACTHLGSLSKGKWIHHKLITSGLKRDNHINASLTSMYAKCGDMETARLVFDRDPEKNVVSWSSIIFGYASHGFANEAISLFEQMVELGLRPNEVTFMAILSACCHAGLVEEGLTYFDMMREKFDIEPQLDHHAAVVDLLSRAGQIERAYDFIELMKVEPDASIWRSLLNGCHIHQKEEMVGVIQRRILFN